MANEAQDINRTKEKSISRLKETIQLLEEGKVKIVHLCCLTTENRFLNMLSRVESKTIHDGAVFSVMLESIINRYKDYITVQMSGDDD